MLFPDKEQSHPGFLFKTDTQLNDTIVSNPTAIQYKSICCRTLLFAVLLDAMSFFSLSPFRHYSYLFGTCNCRQFFSDHITSLSKRFEGTRKQKTLSRKYTTYAQM